MALVYQEKLAPRCNISEGVKKLDFINHDTCGKIHVADCYLNQLGRWYVPFP